MPRKGSKGGKSVYKSIIAPLDQAECSAIVGLIAVGNDPVEACALLHIPMARYAKTFDAHKGFREDVIAAGKPLLIKAENKLRTMGMDGNVRALEDWMVHASRGLPKDDPHRWVNPDWATGGEGGDGKGLDASAYLNKVFEHWCKMDGVELPEGKNSMPADPPDDIASGSEPKNVDISKKKMMP